MAQNEFDVAVIGAGAAGLGAATALMGSGLSVLVLEARERPGGRAYATALDNGETVDLGCGWLHSAETNPFADIALRQGRRLDKSPPPWARPGAHLGPRAGDVAEFAEALGRFRERVESRPAEAPDVACDSLLEPGGRYNALIDAVSTWYSGAELEKVSAADLAAYEDSGVNWRVREGYGAVVAALAQGLPIRYGAAVRVIDRSGGRLAVSGDFGTVGARAVIMTLPSDVLAQTPDLFRPALPEKTQAALDLPLGLADKLYVELVGAHEFPADSRAFGDSSTRATGAYHFKPLGRPLIEGYFGGELAEALEHGGEGAAWEFAAGELKGLFGADFLKRVRPLRFYGWRTDPWARGAYSYARPGRAGSRKALAAAVEERIFFAGEACSAASYSTAHGAYETGLAAAREAMRALG